jgi:hypothetical protein
LGRGKLERKAEVAYKRQQQETKTSWHGGDLRSIEVHAE